MKRAFDSAPANRLAVARPAEIVRGSLLDRKIFHRRGALSVVGGRVTGFGSSPWATREGECANSAFGPNKSSRWSVGCKTNRSSGLNWKRFANLTAIC